MSDSSNFDAVPGMGLRSDGLPDIAWCENVLPGIYKIGSSEFLETLEEQNSVLQHPFRLARYPTTRIQFITFIRDTSVYKKTLESTIGPGHHHAPCPCVYWSDPFRFARWLDQKYREVGLLDEGWMIDVPSEIEWEIAARCPPAEDFESLSHPEQKLGDVNIVANPTTGMALAMAFFEEWCLVSRWHTRENLASDVNAIVNQQIWWNQMAEYVILRGPLIPPLRNRCMPTWSEFTGFRVVCRPKTLPY